MTMLTRLTGGRVIDPANQVDGVADVLIEGTTITRVGPKLPAPGGAETIDATGKVVCPGLIDTNIMQSSRNRPPELAEQGKAGPRAQAFGQGLADRLTTGYPPSEVAEQVVQAIREGRFYVVPAQPEVKAGAALRAQDILELRNPTLRPPR